MKVFNLPDDMRRMSQSLHRDGHTIGLVPTMGFLHEGHLSLVRKARKVADKVVVSIFVNPTQFAPNEDLDKYPRDIERDLNLCKHEKVDFVFLPDNNDMYSVNHQTYVRNEVISKLLCGTTRPTHFRGVTTVVAKLFNIIDPDFSVFGQKDAQQSIIIKNMVRDLNFRTQILVEPIIREKDGLAISSRNKYLTPKQRKQATIIYKSLIYAKHQSETGNLDFSHIKKEIQKNIDNIADFRIDYVEFVEAESLSNKFAPRDKVLLAIAVFAGETRLIDNIVLNTQ
jgi:pantoate--beta-alanine ligase